jgi:hypothetical protein
MFTAKERSVLLFAAAISFSKELLMRVDPGQ